MHELWSPTNMIMKESFFLKIPAWDNEIRHFASINELTAVIIPCSLYFISKLINGYLFILIVHNLYSAFT